MKIKKLVITILVLLTVQMCGPEPKLDYNVTKSESYKISEKKMKKNSLEVKKGFEADTEKYKSKTKEAAKSFLEKTVEKATQGTDESFAAEMLKQMAVSMMEKGIEHQQSKIEEIRFFNDKEAHVTQKVKIFDGSKGNIAKFQNEYELLKLVAQKLKYKDTEDMMAQMEKMNKKEENYIEMTVTSNMNKVNNTWHMKDLDEQIKALETIFSNLANSM